MGYKAVNFIENPGKCPKPPCTPRVSTPRTFRALAAGWLTAAGLAIVATGTAQAQTPPEAHGRGGASGRAGFWDPRRRPDRPGSVASHRDPLPDRDRLSAVQLHPAQTAIRPASTSIWRALCDEIKVTCTIQMRRFETLVDAPPTAATPSSLPWR